MSDGRHAAYVRRVQEEAQRCAESILADNDRLRKRVALLEASRSDLEHRLGKAEEAARLAEPMRALAASLESEKLRLQDRLAETESELARYQEERAALERQLANSEEEGRRAAQQFVDVQQRSSDLANLYVASYQLHDSLDRAAVLAAIREILVNLVGSEEFGIFELGPDGGVRLADWVGVDPAAFEATRTASRISQMALAGDVVVAPKPERVGEPPVVACVPLRVAGRVTGAIAIFGLLAHKPALVRADHDMLDLLASQAGTALYCTRLHQAAQGGGSGRT